MNIFAGLGRDVDYRIRKCVKNFTLVFATEHLASADAMLYKRQLQYLQQKLAMIEDSTTKFGRTNESAAPLILERLQKGQKMKKTLRTGYIGNRSTLSR